MRLRVMAARHGIGGVLLCVCDDLVASWPRGVTFVVTFVAWPSSCAVATLFRGRVATDHCAGRALWSFAVPSRCNLSGRVSSLRRHVL